MEPVNFDLTRRELSKMSSDDLRTMRLALAAYVGTDQEQQARQLNQTIGDILHGRESWSF